MIDARIRELERRWRQTGTVEAEAALLRERARAGLVARDAIGLAAHLGHPAARDAVGKTGPVQGPPGDHELRAFVLGEAEEAPTAAPDWISEIHRLGGDVALRRLAASALRRSPHIPAEALDAVEAWIVSPSPALKDRCRHDLADDGALTREVAKLVLTWGGRDVVGRDVLVATCRTLLLCFGAEAPQSGIALATRELISWSLGYGDPAAERVRALESAPGNSP